jgi:formylglycine-generating enzyme required for sulfatase activity
VTRTRGRVLVAGLVVLGSGALTVGCGRRTKELPPLGEILVTVDTDMPVPRFVARLRIDFYTPDHVWYGSRDLARGKSTDFPTSFGVYIPDDLHDRDVLVRLRGYPEGEIRDYRGERFLTRPPAGATPGDLAVLPAPTDQPRLFADDGSDATPSSEPKPELAVDRLIRVRVTPGERAQTNVVLRGACVGTMVDLANEESCVDTEGARLKVDLAETVPEAPLGTTSLAGSFEAAAKCTAAPRPAGKAADGSPLRDEEVCVDGALFVFGSNYAFGLGNGVDATKRVAFLAPYRIDKYEVSVGRWRAALAAGLVAPNGGPIANDTPIPRDGTDTLDPRSCTYSSSPMGREDFPVACITAVDAEAFCKLQGGELPTEAQWEYVAMHAGRTEATPFAWGGEPGLSATCDQAWFGRGALPINNDCNKDGQHFGAGPVQANEGPGGDVSLGLGIIGLTGSIVELTRDSFVSLASNCWYAQPLHDPACLVGTSLGTTVRGGSWAAPHTSVTTSRRFQLAENNLSTEVGFRCARGGT